MLCRKHMFLLTTVVQKAVSRGLHVPGGAVELGGPTTSRAQMSKGLSLFLLVYLSGWSLKATRRKRAFVFLELVLASATAEQFSSMTPQ